MRRLALVGALLTACGGGEEPPPVEEKKVEVIAPVVMAPPVVVIPPVVIPPPVVTPPPVIPVPPPVITPEPPPPPKILWSEPWADPLISGAVNQPIINCAGGISDPQMLETMVYPSPGAKWHEFGNSGKIARDILSKSDGALVIHSQQTLWQGWAIVSAQQFSPDQTLTLEGKVTLQPDPGAWVSLPLIAGEGDYRQISLREDNGNITADLGAPCYYKSLATFPPGERKLTLSYHPKDGWTYSVDGTVLHREPLSHAGANLTGPVRVGIYIVNVGVEGLRLSSGLVRVSIGTLTLTE